MDVVTGTATDLVVRVISVEGHAEGAGGPCVAEKCGMERPGAETLTGGSPLAGGGATTVATGGVGSSVV